MEHRQFARVLFGLVAGVIGLTEDPGRAMWTIEPVDLSGDVGWSLQLGIDTTGTPHAAYFTTNPNGDFHYSRRNQSGWQRQAVIDNANAFAIDQNGDRYFISEPGPNFYPNFQILLDNGLLLGQQLAATRISDGAFLKFDSQNRPQIGWVDTTAQQLKQSYWNGTSWTTRTVASGSEFRFGNSSFSAALDPNDQMHFTWRTEANRLQYARPNGANWQVTSPFPTLNARPYDMDVDAAGNVHLAYDNSTGNVFTGGLTYGFYNGSSWSGGRIPNLEAFGAGRSQIVVDSSNEPHVFTYDSAFSGPDKLKHVYRVNGSWTNETIDSYTSNSSGPDNIEAKYDAHGFHVLYSTGNQQIFYAFQPAAAALAGDFDKNDVVDAADFVAWKSGLGIVYTAADYDTWRANYGRTAGSGSSATLVSSALAAVPEPSGCASVAWIVVVAYAFAHRRGQNDHTELVSAKSGRR